jgi:hypothetical protein
MRCFPDNPRSGLSGTQIHNGECPAKLVIAAMFFWLPDMRFAHSGE